jgi:hypothetical protein
MESCRDHSALGHGLDEMAIAAVDRIEFRAALSDGRRIDFVAIAFKHQFEIRYDVQSRIRAGLRPLA